MKRLSQFTKGFTHSGVFHADEVFASALLKFYLGDNFPIERGFSIPTEDNVLVFDIGLGEFDHHQSNGETRLNGIKYSAFGLLWAEIGTELFPIEWANKFDDKFVSQICSHDNGQGKSQLSEVISSFNPNWDVNSNGDKEFNLAVEFAMCILGREFVKLNSEIEAQELVQSALDVSDGNIVVLHKFAPWQNILVPSDAKFVVYPSQRGGWNLQTIPTEVGGLIPKVPLPKEWWGTTEDFKSIGGTFCHANGFLSSFEYIEVAISIAKSLI